IGILRDVFKFISLGDLPEQMEWIVDDISEVLATTDVNQILHRFYQEGKGKDPIIHFYETFLAEYDPKERERRGVYYTPDPVVSYIVRSLNIILKEHFDKADGFADSSVTVLDPAAGTLTFLAEASKVAVEEFTARYGEGGRESFVRDHVLKDFYALELMMAPYAIGHLKMSFLLEELGYKLKEDERFKLYLTNTLEMEDLEQTALPGMSSLAEESHLAGKVKKQTPILVVLGNPPYSGISANIGEWISKEIRAYYQVDGKPLGERNPKWLQDDYVKFIRFAQWKIDQAGEGVLGFITNHSYLDNPTFRGMRQSLMNSFNHLYFLDLHGNTLKKERCPDGSKDENVFDIRPGVAIALFIKKRNSKEKKVVHHERWGTRESKYDWLRENDIKTTKWQELTPHSESHFFVPRDERLLAQYEKYPKITEIFPTNSVGIVTARDKFVIDNDRAKLKRRIEMFRDLSIPDEVVKQAFKLKDTKGWKLAEARRELARDEKWNTYFTKMLYRPFDIQWTFYNGAVVERSRKEVMRHMMQENLGLCVGRAGQVVGLKKYWNILFCSEFAEDFNLFYRGGNVNLPLYLYPDKDKKDMFSQLESGERKPNLNPELVKLLTASYGREPSPEEIFYYIYGVLYSNTYRTRYAQFLKSAFPRVPITADYKLFTKVGEYGKQLADLHLLKSAELNESIARFPSTGDNRIQKVKYDGENRVYINDNQYFEGIPRELWEYQIGGYQVLDKWLKDRKKADQPLSADDIKHYCRVATALAKTIELQERIDELYPNIEKKCVTPSL
ncbi:MAG: N-6 DNA methylase, partial [Dehalococcoidia bacterium]|nr:N-6 DNA methylase [Dehalococcoidia bacterium]